MPLLSLRGLTKSYAHRPVLRGVDLDLDEGEILGIAGPNGAGKTTLVECLAGLREKDGGTITVAGIDPSRPTPELRRLLGGQLQQIRVPGVLRTREVLELFATFYPDPLPPDQLMEEFDLSSQSDQAFAKLSGGQQQRLSVALALIGRPRIAVLDELTTGLDPAARRRIWAQLERRRAEGMTMLLVTHSMEEAQRLCDRMVILQDGEIIADGSPQQIVGRTGVQRTTFQAELDEAVLTELEECEDVDAVARSGGAIAVDGGDASPQAVLAHLARRGIRARGVGVDRPTLEDAYHRLVTGEEHENAAPGARPAAASGARPADERTLR
ncbi:multidrug ABC transporter ATP-binding protein [Brachybacterium sp. P6-10-X1]|uniref:ABC transporter ATP-binding protein n=1 Tax=Brachybacterium sp. P6-10-X1 TaxID=1903186 RepID=UPI000971B2D0|nr:ABC transporter ATP-binding protein [Brachybacterium sp. P6-10-X1]APX32665.1 multidrug ABC transporter ATP-binding protein [Brachybacterium sp. P6-10-X1]